MFKSVLIVVVLCFCLTISGYGNDLYRVWIDSRADAERLIDNGAEAVVRVNGGYLVLADGPQAGKLEASGLKIVHLSTGVEKNHLALDNRRDELNTFRFPALYSDGGFRLFQVDNAEAVRSDDGSRLIPIHNEFLKIEYNPPKYLNDALVFQSDGLQEVIDGVDQDSVNYFLHQLEAFDGRLSGTASNYSARDWIASRFTSFGYPGVQLEHFTGYQLYGYDPVNSYNVIARKTGTRYPDRQIVIGAHFDAVPGSPGADDNGSGTTGVIEIARALADIETEMTIIFVTFDSEESGLHGAWDYADQAAYSGDSIICMLNMDMIGHYSNDLYVDVQYGPEQAYAELWIRLADSLVGLEGLLGGQSSNSDHYAFVQNGYDVAYAAEYNFSNVYHTYRDSTTRINFEYMTKIIKGTLATAYAVGTSPLPVEITAIRDGGDGQSMQVNWVGDNGIHTDHYTVYFDTEPPSGLDSVVVTAADTSALLTGMTLGQQYAIRVIAYDIEGDGSVIYNQEYGSPNIIPATPQGLRAQPFQRAIHLDWAANNNELDFSHYTLIRDGVVLPETTTDTFFVDDDFSLESDFHSYIVLAEDNDGFISDTIGVEETIMRAATFEPGRILAVNRSGKQSALITHETVTGEFMRDALNGYNYDYYSDTAHGSPIRPDSFQLVDMLDYELVIFGAESGRGDDLGNDPIFGGIMDTIGYYMSLGGKVIVFGRWGEFSTSGQRNNQIAFSPANADFGFYEYFHMSSRTQVLSVFTPTTISSQLIGAQNIVPEYPVLTWDSLASVDHSAPWTEVSGIPCPSHPWLRSGPELIYTAEARDDSAYIDNKALAWRYIEDDYKYVFFEIPLSFIERSSANGALQAAVADLISDGPGAFATQIDIDTLDIPTGPPATVTVYLGDFRSGMIAGDVDVSTVYINNDLVPQSTSVLSSYPGFTGEVLEIIVEGDAFAATYGAINDTTETVYAVSWNFNGDPNVNFNSGPVAVIPTMFKAGDANGDWSINVGDAVYMINYVFKGGPAPDPMVTGDANGDCSLNVGDAVYLINYVFKSGPDPIANPACVW
ncbi:MAG: M28 family peptidase [FCB group bacterium]|nr:M28 family peptidase [FCB group bacterium]